VHAHTHTHARTTSVPAHRWRERGGTRAEGQRVMGECEGDDIEGHHVGHVGVGHGCGR
jgi:hypothetical protein